MWTLNPEDLNFYLNPEDPEPKNQNMKTWIANPNSQTHPPTPLPSSLPHRPSHPNRPWHTPLPWHTHTHTPRHTHTHTRTPLNSSPDPPSLPPKPLPSQRGNSFGVWRRIFATLLQGNRRNVLKNRIHLRNLLLMLPNRILCSSDNCMGGTRASTARHPLHTNTDWYGTPKLWQPTHFNANKKNCWIAFVDPALFPEPTVPVPCQDHDKPSVFLSCLDCKQSTCIDGAISVCLLLWYELELLLALLELTPMVPSGVCSATRSANLTFLLALIQELVHQFSLQKV